MSVLHKRVATTPNDPAADVQTIRDWNDEHAGELVDSDSTNHVAHGARGAGLHADSHTNALDHSNALDHAEAHAVTSAADHTASGLTVGQVLKALTATTFGWIALAFSEVSGVISDAQHGSRGSALHVDSHSNALDHAQDHDDTHHTQSPILKSLVTALGDLIYATANAAVARLAGNITTTRKFLSQTGDGANSAAPTWSVLAFSDYPHVHRASDVGNSLGVLGEILTALGSLTISENGRVGPSTGNQIFMQGSAAGGGLVSWTATSPGGDADVDMQFNPRGTGRVRIFGASSGVTVGGTIIAGSQNNNSLTMAGSSSAVAVSLTATGTDNDISVNVVTKGAGRLQENGVNVVTTTDARLLPTLLQVQDPGGSFTVPTGGRLTYVTRGQLSGTERGTLRGTGRIYLKDDRHQEIKRLNFATFELRQDEYLIVNRRGRTQGTNRGTLRMNARVYLLDEQTNGRGALTGRGVNS